MWIFAAAFCLVVIIVWTLRRPRLSPSKITRWAATRATDEELEDVSVVQFVYGESMPPQAALALALATGYNSRLGAWKDRAIGWRVIAEAQAKLLADDSLRRKWLARREEARERMTKASAADGDPGGSP